jgi:hypothetical protein
MVASPRNQRSHTSISHFRPTCFRSCKKPSWHSLATANVQSVTTSALNRAGATIPMARSIPARNAAFVSSCSVTGGGHHVRTSFTALLPLVPDTVSGSSSFDPRSCRLFPPSSSARLCLVTRCAIQFEGPAFRERDFVVSMVSVNGLESLLRQGDRVHGLRLAASIAMCLLLTPYSNFRQLCE